MLAQNRWSSEDIEWHWKIVYDILWTLNDKSKAYHNRMYTIVTRQNGNTIAFLGSRFDQGHVLIAVSSRWIRTRWGCCQCNPMSHEWNLGQNVGWWWWIQCLQVWLNLVLVISLVQSYLGILDGLLRCYALSDVSSANDNIGGGQGSMFGISSNWYRYMHCSKGIHIANRDSGTSPQLSPRCVVMPKECRLVGWDCIEGMIGNADSINCLAESMLSMNASFGH
jgi:hypothetical protein